VEEPAAVAGEVAQKEAGERKLGLEGEKDLEVAVVPPPNNAAMVELKRKVLSTLAPFRKRYVDAPPRGGVRSPGALLAGSGESLHLQKVMTHLARPMPWPPPTGRRVLLSQKSGGECLGREGETTQRRHWWLLERTEGRREH
jgi:hypothetical protein